jgi:hypothetical protein
MGQVKAGGQARMWGLAGAACFVMESLRAGVGVW